MPATGPEEGRGEERNRGGGGAEDGDKPGTLDEGAPGIGGVVVDDEPRAGWLALCRVTATELDDLTIRYHIGDLTFDNQIEITPIDPSHPFSRAGDSGSLIVDQQMRAVALLFAGNGVDATYANPIEEVLTALQVDLQLA